jgi:hypothetical protein
LGASLFCVIFTHIYALFGHGVRSPAMDLMFLYPLAGGALPFFVLGRFFPRFAKRRFFRPGCNLYNSGIAALTAGALLRGILEIAGTGSRWIGLFFAAGAIMVLGGAGLMIAGKK